MNPLHRTLHFGSSRALRGQMWIADAFSDFKPMSDAVQLLVRNFDAPRDCERMLDVLDKLGFVVYEWGTANADSRRGLIRTAVAHADDLTCGCDLTAVRDAIFAVAPLGTSIRFTKYSSCGEWETNGLPEQELKDRDLPNVGAVQFVVRGFGGEKNGNGIEWAIRSFHIDVHWHVHPLTGSKWGSLKTEIVDVRDVVVEPVDSLGRIIKAIFAVSPVGTVVRYRTFVLDEADEMNKFKE